MDLVELCVEVDPESVEPVSEAFRRYGCHRLVVEHLDPTTDQSRVSVKAYIPNDTSAEKTRSQIDLVVRLLGLVRPLGPLQSRLLSEEDWARAWQKHFKVLHIGRRIVVCPSWLSYDRKPNDALVILDPGMAFGTGLHPTTKMCLEALDCRIRNGMEILDVGTGSGILSIAAANLGASRVLALDVDPVAVRVARDNVTANGVGQAVEIREGTLPQDDQSSRPRFDIVVANIAVRPIVQLAPHILDCLRPGDLAVVSGILDDQAQEVEDSFGRLGAVIKDQVGVEDWRTLVFEKA